jgi:carboxylate-amine ligase
MVYFSARLSARYPTVEIRVADVCTDVDDAVLIAAICRALVEKAAADWRDDVGEHPNTVATLRAAGWRAARYGMDGPLFDARTGRLVDPWSLANDLVEFLGSTLDDAGDAELVATGLDRIRRRGTGARQQRASAATAGGLRAVVIDAAARTSAA